MLILWVPQVNGLCIEVDRLRVAAGFSSGIGLDKKIGTLQNSYAEPTLGDQLHHHAQVTVLVLCL